MIMAHDQFDLLSALISCLDDEKNDIYLHVDAKKADFPDFSAHVTASTLHMIEPRISTNWGGVSLLAAEIALLEHATKQGKNYDYYHLISGVDLPIKSQEQIHQFFDRHQGKNFISFEGPLVQYADRVKYYWAFPEYSGKSATGIGIPIRILNRISFALQWLFRVDRRHGLAYQKGSQWFSITDSLARAIVGDKQRLLDMYQHTSCSDEVFIQTYVDNSDYRNTLYMRNYTEDGQGAMRHIVWEKRSNSPETLTFADYDTLQQSQMLFARKFDYIKHSDIVDRVISDLCKRPTTL
jgi:hypothetical protein